jgi:hypothetical protein
MRKDYSLEKNKPSSDSLQQRIEDIAFFRLEDGIAALTELVPGLKTSISYTGERVITHEAYTGTANLNRLARIYLAFGWRCGEENARLSTRLQHLDLHDAFAALYKESKGALENTAVAWILNGFREFGLGCAHCRGVPAAVIPDSFRIYDALYFDMEQYQRLWGDKESFGSTSTWDRETGELKMKLLATSEQVREAIARGADVETGDKETA